MYETEKTRLYSLLEQKTGRVLKRNQDLEIEADERALEARNQVGLDYTGTDSDNIKHDLDMWEELPYGVTTYGENAAWFYLWRDPVAHAADAWMASDAHRHNLLNPEFTNWGLGIHTELPPGDTNELYRRWYFICLFTNDPKIVAPTTPPVIPTGDCPKGLVQINNRKVTIFGGVNIRLRPELGSEDIDYQTAANKTVPLVGSVTGDDYIGTTKWYVFLDPERGGQWRYVNSRGNLVGNLVRIE